MSVKKQVSKLQPKTFGIRWVTLGGKHVPIRVAERAIGSKARQVRESVRRKGFDMTVAESVHHVLNRPYMGVHVGTRIASDVIVGRRKEKRALLARAVKYPNLTRETIPLGVPAEPVIKRRPKLAKAVNQLAETRINRPLESTGFEHTQLSGGHKYRMYRFNPIKGTHEYYTVHTKHPVNDDLMHGIVAGISHTDKAHTRDSIQKLKYLSGGNVKAYVDVVRRSGKKKSRHRL